MNTRKSSIRSLTPEYIEDRLAKWPGLRKQIELGKHIEDRLAKWPGLRKQIELVPTEDGFAKFGQPLAKLWKPVFELLLFELLLLKKSGKTASFAL